MEFRVQVMLKYVSFYFDGANSLIEDNVTIIFLEGSHQIPTRGMVLTRLNNITLQGSTTNDAATSVLRDNGRGIVITNCNNVIVREIRINTSKDSFNEMGDSLYMLNNSNMSFENVSITTQNGTSVRYGMYMRNSRNITLSGVEIVGIFTASANIAVFDFIFSLYQIRTR